ncbi:MAG: bacillithiol biosynthesis cysteine-adding enzyme BshC, partial [Saprospiraceae bacterium]
MSDFTADIVHINPLEIAELKPLELQYWNNPNDFDRLISLTPELDNVPQMIELKKSQFHNRNEICDILLNQYQDIGDDNILHQINLIKQDHTFTIICAHQALLLGGSLYWWYKIIHTIRLSIDLKKTYPEYEFIPIYYAGNEDHDFIEINHLNLFSKEYSWTNHQEGACGRMNPSEIAKVIDEIALVFQNNKFATTELNLFKELLVQSNQYDDFFRKFVHHLFGKYGLVYFNPDDKQAKLLLSPYIASELVDHSIVKTSKESLRVLQEMSFQSQAHIRDINLFYLIDNYRVGIYYEDSKYHTKDFKYNWDQINILQELKEFPERFSPNVVFRPIYQESLFPNLIFVGGGAEVAYWLQLKSAFQNWNIPYPILWRRFSAIIFTENTL